MTWRPIGILMTFALGLLAGRLAAEAQQPEKIYRVGVLSVGLPMESRL